MLVGVGLGALHSPLTQGVRANDYYGIELIRRIINLPFSQHIRQTISMTSFSLICFGVCCYPAGGFTDLVSLLSKAVRRPGSRCGSHDVEA